MELCDFEDGSNGPGVPDPRERELLCYDLSDIHTRICGFEDEFYFDACSEEIEWRSDASFYVATECLSFISSNNCTQFQNCFFEWLESSDGQEPDIEPPIEPEPPNIFVTVYIEALGNPNGNTGEDPYPGPDIDAVGVLSMRLGQEFFAVEIEQYSIDERDNPNTDPFQILGPPDAQCDVNTGNFVSLGEFGLVSVYFNTPAGQLTNGDLITVYELGPSLCDIYEDEPMGIWVGDEFGSLLYQGEAFGASSIPIRGL